MSKAREKMFQMAFEARQQAYSPYSHKLVGACVLMDDGEMYAGCNVENASYGATICAERVAITKAISEAMSRRIQEVLVITDAEKPWPPCGMCRQVIGEFALHDTLVHVQNLQGQGRTFLFAELFPEGFSPVYLQK
jgi:cytidine deaminase